MDMLSLIFFVCSVWFLYCCWNEDPIKDRKLALCDRQASYGRIECEALFMRDVGMKYMVQCFGVAE